MRSTKILLATGFSILLLVTFVAGNQSGRSNSTSSQWVSYFDVLRILNEEPGEPSLVARNPATSKRWLEGTWEGTAYQSDTKENWMLKLSVKNGTYRVDYPSLKCGGEWRPIRLGKRIATFKEKLTYGHDECVDNVTVTIRKLNRRQVAYWYVEPKQTRVNGIAVLDRK